MKKLAQADLDGLVYHYTGNCFGCDRCGFFQAVTDGQPGAAEAYAAYMREHHGVELTLVDDGEPPPR